MVFSISDIVLIGIAVLISGYAQVKVSTTFNKYLKVRSLKGLTGAQVARSILNNNGLNDVRIEEAPGRLSDHYDPKFRVVRLSSDVYNGESIAAIGVAAHETGHAIQHSLSYAPLKLRSSLFPLANIGSSLAWIFVIIGFIFGAVGGVFIKIGIILFVFAVAFQVVTLPVEFNASRRALSLLTDGGYLTEGEIDSTKKVLSAAAFTYVAAALVAILELVRMLLISRDE